MRVTKKCPFTGQLNDREINVTEEQIVEWQQGALIQDVMPELDADDREFLMTGITPDVWEAHLGAEA